jgi:hypothetical protein
MLLRLLFYAVRRKFTKSTTITYASYCEWQIACFCFQWRLCVPPPPFSNQLEVASGPACRQTTKVAGPGVDKINRKRRIDRSSSSPDPSWHSIGSASRAASHGASDQGAIFTGPSCRQAVSAVAQRYRVNLRSESAERAALTRGGGGVHGWRGGLAVSAALTSSAA